MSCKSVLTKMNGLTLNTKILYCITDQLLCSGQYSWPESIRHMDEFKHLVSICLEVDSSKRARIEQVVEKARSFLNELHDY